MRTFAQHLKLAKGSICKAAREYKAERRWFRDEWYLAWPTGLADEVENAIGAWLEVR
jgi:hypothetical protein